MNIEKSSGFAQNSGMGLNPVILVVDFMKGFTDRDSPLGSNLDNEIKATNELLNIARKECVPIIFTSVSYDSGFQEGAHFIRKIPALKILSAGSEACEIDPRLERNEQTELLVVKKFASAFFGTAISSVLSHQRIDCISQMKIEPQRNLILSHL
ncbi:isochorismatase family protein [Planococcus kocurii]|uniref:isochorismatase family protein n=1 Tax=Planococcus kocurii TaxID=1374 RepID=UPI003D052FC7